MASSTFEPERPWPFPAKEDCVFYHSFDFPDGESIQGQWDLIGCFDAYTGHVPLVGKTVADVGTASGFLSFEAERMGASHVTSIDGFDGTSYDRVPFHGAQHHERRLEWNTKHEKFLRQMRNSYWYAHHKLRSRAETIYLPLTQLAYWDRNFDVVIAGAIIEHLADPISFLGSLARMAREKVIIGYTHIPDEDVLYMMPNNSWTDPSISYGWWHLSRGLYERVFSNLGFKITGLNKASAFANYTGTREKVWRSTLVASRV